MTISSKLVCATFRHRIGISWITSHHKVETASFKAPYPRSFIQIRNMETFKLPNSDPTCAVSLPADLTEAKVMGFKPFTRWISTLQKSISSQSNTNHPFHSLPYKLRSIRIQSVDFFGERIGFLKLKAEVTNDKGDWLPGAVFMRGPSVTMLVNSSLTLSSALS
jgi:hypothetical protein